MADSLYRQLPARKTFRAIPLAVCLLWATAACNAQGLELKINKNTEDVDSAEVTLPAANGTMDIRWIEWSEDLVNWYPLAREYDDDWQSMFPKSPEILDGSLIDALTGESGQSKRFYRIATASTVNQLSNEEAAARFLQQATFGPTYTAIQNFPGIAEEDFQDAPYTYIAAWIDAQMALPLSSHRAFFRERSDPAYTDNSANSPFEVAANPLYGDQISYYVGQTRIRPDTQAAIDAGRSANDVQIPFNEDKRAVWHTIVHNAEDRLRQKIAWALSQHFVVGEEGSDQTATTERWTKYYDIFVRHAFGNFRDILGEVTYSPHMGYYLTYTDNRVADPSKGTFPDENYAREVMQLFTIGLWELNQNGTLKLDASGEPIPTYTITDIEEFAKIFTGLRRQENRINIEIQGGNYIDPMRVQVNWHDFTEKTLLDGSKIGPFPETEEGVYQEIDVFLDHLFAHENVPPFIARFLIQRFVTSNPSPTYIFDVAQAFIDGDYQGTGNGQRGDLGATIRAVLLHPEARNPALSMDAGSGRLREPLERLLNVATSLNLTSVQTHNLITFDDLLNQIGQEPYMYPTVFNFYLPDYQPNGAILDYGYFAPEFQVLNDITALRVPNAIRELVEKGIEDDIGWRGYEQAVLDYSEMIAIATDAAAIVDRLNLLLCAGRLNDANRTTIINVLESMPNEDVEDTEDRIKKALALIALMPGFNTIY